MEIFITILILVCVIAWWRNSTEKSNINNYEQEKQKNTTIEKNTSLKLSFSALKEIGCQPTIEDDSIYVLYQGENFQFDCKGLYVRIWDPSWGQIKSDDNDLPKIREAINAANYNFGPTVLLSNPNNSGDIVIHSKRDIMLHPSFTDSSEYIKAVLDSFFPIKEYVREEYKQIEDRQKQINKKHRPIGFAAIRNMEMNNNEIES